MKLLSFSLVFALLTAQSAGSEQSNGLIWTDPGAIASKDLYWGRGSQGRAPKPPFAFVEENLKGTTPKLVVKDAAGVMWDVKFDVEAHSDVAANRLMWALGFPVPEAYYLHNGTITGVRKLDRAARYVKGNRFEEGARFRRRDPQMVKGDGWALASNPFVGTKELSGLIIMQALINNWDTDLDKNQAVYTIGGRRWYLADDIGASFGRFAQDSPIKWNLAEYRKDKLIASVAPDAIVLNYRAYGTPPTRIPMAHARWFAGLASQLTRTQVKAAFDAAGTAPGEIEGFVDVFMSKVEELKAAVKP